MGYSPWGHNESDMTEQLKSTNVLNISINIPKVQYFKWIKNRKFFKNH